MADATHQHVPEEHRVKRTGGWLSQDRRHHNNFISDTIKHVDNNPKDLDPVLVEFREMVENDARLRMLFEAMFDEIPHTDHYLKDPIGESPQVRDFPHLLQLLTHILTTGPSWTDAGNKVGIIGTPVHAILSWPMGTKAGFAVFQDPKVNAQVKKILNVWGKFLSSSGSAYVLDDSKTGWLGPTGKSSLEKVANRNGATSYTFEEIFHCDPSSPNHGYKSWDDFFTRLLKDDIRPVASPEDDNVVANACESKFYKLAHDVRGRDKFWIKGQPYSVKDMLANDPYAEKFVGGTIYQAFLSALSYHRWHSPVSGTIKKAWVIDGTYYSQPGFTDAMNDGDGIDDNGETTGQEYISAMATRGVVIIEADNKKLGLVGFVGIGMIEVSTCDITVKVGDKVKKGDQLGMFHFGGSSHTVLFEKGVKVSGFPGESEENVPVRSKLCVVE